MIHEIFGLRRRPAAALSALLLAMLPAMPATAQTAPADDTATAEAPVAGEAPEPLADIVLGEEDAPVTVIEYASFTCSHCGDFATNSFPKLKAEYIDSGKVNYVQRDVYFDAVGLWAGILAHCDSAKYYPIAETLLTTQEKWLTPVKTGDEAADNLRKIGLASGMTDEQMDACWNDEKMVEQLVSTYQTNAMKDGVEGTPTFIIDGEKVPNQPWPELKKIIDAKLADTSAQ